MPAGGDPSPAEALGVRSACAWVVERARDVRLGPLQQTLSLLSDRQVPRWDRRRHFTDRRDRMVAYILVLDTINFSFWGGPGGYWKLAQGLRDAFAAGDPLWEPERLESLRREELTRWTGDLPMMDQRVQALRELGAAGGLLGHVKDSAILTVRGLAKRLKSYADVADYESRAIPLLKRAQIVCADLHGAGLAEFADLDALTCFPDYKLPQVLRHFGALEYSPALAGRIDGWQELRPGEPAEVEIRAATVVAVERLRQELEEGGRRLRAFEVDWMLWEVSQTLYPVRPHHRVRTIFY